MAKRCFSFRCFVTCLIRGDWLYGVCLFFAFWDFNGFVICFWVFGTVANVLNMFIFQVWGVWGLFYSCWIWFRKFSVFIVFCFILLLLICFCLCLLECFCFFSVFLWFLFVVVCSCVLLVGVFVFWGVGGWFAFAICVCWSVFGAVVFFFFCFFLFVSKTQLCLQI